MLDSTLTPEDLLSHEVELPSAPLIFQKLNMLIADPNSNSEDFAALVEQDPGLTARLLRVVNSPFFGLRQKIVSTAWAVTLLGLKELRDLVVATTVINRFRGFNNTLISMERFWHQSLRCAVIAKALLPATERSDSAESIFVSGLLHEIGHLILYRQLPELMRQAVLEHEASGNPIWQYERQLFGFDYAAMGGALLKRWSMPDSLIVPVIFHPEPDTAPDFRRESAIIHLASQVAGIEIMSAENIDSHLPANSPVWRIAGIQPSSLPELVERVKKRLEGTSVLVD